MKNPEISKVDRLGLKTEQNNINSDDDINIINGYWSSDKNGMQPITKANLDELVYFNIKTSRKFEGKEIKLKLFEDDGDLRKPDEKFPAISNDKKNLIKREYIKTVKIKNQKATIEISLLNIWDSILDKDFGFEIELYWVAYQKDFLFLGERLYSTLNVSRSLRYIYLNTPIDGYSLPELLTSMGETIIFAIGDASKVNDLVTEKLDDARFFIGCRTLKQGNLVTNSLDIIKREKSRLYQYHIYNNEGTNVNIIKASNFGFKNKYVNNGKVVTTKGISQIDYFTNNGVLNNTLKLSKEIINIWDFTSLTDIMFKDGFGTIPNPTPVGWAVDILTQFVIIPHFNEIISELKKAAFVDFEKAKQKGLKACIEYIDKSTLIRKDFLKMKHIAVSTKTLNKLLKGDFLTIDNLIKFRDQNSISTSEWIHTIFYREEKDNYREDPRIIIECIFIADKLIKL